MDENKNGFEQSSISDSKDLPERLKILVKQLKRGIHNAEILDETLKKMSEQFHNSGSVLKKISEKSTAKTSRKNLHDYVDKDCMNTYSAINILGDNHLRISDEINELIESKYHTGLENLRLRCKTLDKQNGECVASLRKQRVNIELLKQRAIKKITNEFEKDYNIRTNGTPSKQRLSVMVRFGF
ncbi:hypothetical protein MHBO_004000 [Bonamia ostreae]|uniref:Uncharacterized protein n=1 Tax=Bonamia ostreae TaxID=126728 RepID=A0ABV2AS63_9EUKA